MSFIDRAVVVAAGEGEVVTALGSRYIYKVLGHHTREAFSLVEETLLDSDGSPLHVHENEDETFYVLDGQGLFVVGETQRELRRGDLVVVPRGVAHTLAPRGNEPLRMLVVVSPVRLERFFVEVEQQERAGIELDEDGVVALAAEYGTRIVAADRPLKATAAAARQRVATRGRSGRCGVAIARRVVISEQSCAVAGSGAVACAP